MPKAATLIGIWGAAALTLLAVSVARTSFAPARPPAARPAIHIDTPFQAVLLDNGQVYYGKITGLGTEFPKMTDMYYVVNTEDPKTKQVHHVLVKRGKELHAPTEAFFEARHILMIEDVGPNSEVAALIKQAESQAKQP